MVGSNLCRQQFNSYVPQSYPPPALYLINHCHILSGFLHHFLWYPNFCLKFALKTISRPNELRLQSSLDDFWIQQSTDDSIVICPVGTNLKTILKVIQWSLSYIECSQFEKLHLYLIKSIVIMDGVTYGFYDSQHSGFPMPLGFHYIWTVVITYHTSNLTWNVRCILIYIKMVYLTFFNIPS